jgi:hypothetical protein
MFCANSYGDVGTSVIMSTLYRLYIPDTQSKAIAPFRYSTFAALVIVPFVAIRLISEDLGCTTDQAYRTLFSSSDVGAAIHPTTDNDDEIEDIHERNWRLGNKERAQVSFLIYLGLSSFTCT